MPAQSRYFEFLNGSWLVRSELNAAPQVSVACHNFCKTIPAEESDELLQTYIDDCGEQHPREVARIWAWRGEKDLAFEWFYRADEAGSDGGKSFIMDPLFAKLHDDRRWAGFPEERRFSETQLAALEFPVELLTEYRGE
jgi:hypothetical protein